MSKKKNKRSGRRTVYQARTIDSSMIQALEKPIDRCFMSADLFEMGMGYVIIIRKAASGPVIAVIFLLYVFFYVRINDMNRLLYRHTDHSGVVVHPYEFLQYDFLEWLPLLQHKCSIGIETALPRCVFSHGRPG